MKCINSKLLDRLYLIVNLSGLYLTILSIYHTADKSLSSYNTLEPLSVENIDDDTKIYTFDVSHFTENNNDITVYTNHLFTRVYSDDELLYEDTKDGGIWGRTPGSKWHFTPFLFLLPQIRFL